ncbi:heterogeneous nuclear ribonucleoprotein A, putative [Trichomonas vaginalis G3]|uniref:receptor protein-tyrosine kinase n=1 Tax=Trichomonas vaginalis (strain ATCC PRA-98 / G3) TaxID=412133 RepID=A2EK26_TRIV3|nr:glycine-rich protein family [Trichomonas vaginalis G3]EAY07010.1 heterogeneous nuclear ribonucleoprotein A, putative [Trichomonas vaginalis G3]KAI5488810.1 glycine-rich protein family [Trichomonas vaginalis G3]|eukprot:XP_001319233.1 heterogeneous nuclear ribonucleoprotein A [Trichomonas vaginalis G3]
MLKYKLVNESKVGAQINVTTDIDQYFFDYPCTSSSDCTDYEVALSPGLYKFELYGSSGGSLNGVTSYRFPDGSCISEEIVNRYRGNTQCRHHASVGGAGGYISGIILLRKSTLSYITIGGKGTVNKDTTCYHEIRCFEQNLYSPGGYGGGGSTPAHPTVGSGGGQTAVKFIENNLWHRVIVAGSGGGADNIYGNFQGTDDGSGGSGGGLIAQGWFENGTYKNDYFANSTFGFSFGFGEAAQLYGSKNVNGVHKYSSTSDKSGSGSGWFGGFASHDPDSGSGGGSSWALSKDAIIPPGKINSVDDFFTSIGSYEYAFSKTDYLFSNVIHQAGIWDGNGRVIITILQYEVCPTYKNFFNLNFLLPIYVFLLSK